MKIDMKMSEKEVDALDWAIRQSQIFRGLTMHQMVRIMHLWSAILKKKKRLTDREVKRIWK